MFLERLSIMTSVLTEYQTLISGIIGIIAGYVLSKIRDSMDIKKQEYDRRLRIYQSLLSNTMQVASYEFVAAFNMLLVEFKDDKDILDARSKFLDTVSAVPPMEDVVAFTKQQQNFEDSLIRLITLVGRKINIDIEQMDIKNKMYWPKIFTDNSQQQKNLIDILIKTQTQWLNVLEKINNQEISLSISPVDKVNIETISKKKSKYGK